MYKKVGKWMSFCCTVGLNTAPSTRSARPVTIDSLARPIAYLHRGSGRLVFKFFENKTFFDKCYAFYSVFRIFDIFAHFVCFKSLRCAAYTRYRSIDIAIDASVGRYFCFFRQYIAVCTLFV